MVGEGEIARLAERKQALIHKNEQARIGLADDFAAARSVGGWLDSGIDRARRMRPILICIAPFAGYALIRRRKAFGELFRAAKSGLRVARTFQKAAGFLRRN